MPRPSFAPPHCSFAPPHCAFPPSPAPRLHRAALRRRGRRGQLSRLSRDGAAEGAGPAGAAGRRRGAGPGAGVGVREGAVCQPAGWQHAGVAQGCTGGAGSPRGAQGCGEGGRQPAWVRGVPGVLTARVGAPGSGGSLAALTRGRVCRGVLRTWGVLAACMDAQGSPGVLASGVGAQGSLGALVACMCSHGGGIHRA